MTVVGQRGAPGDVTRSTADWLTVLANSSSQQHSVSVHECGGLSVTECSRGSHEVVDGTRDHDRSSTGC